jgi:hypothetical protein
MGLSVKIVLLMASLAGASFACAQEVEAYDEKYLTVTAMDLKEIKKDPLNQEKQILVYSEKYQVKGLPNQRGLIEGGNPIEQAGKVIDVAKDLVALGEDIYRLVTKGRPSNITKYDPISVIPKVNGQPVDIMATENWKMPVKKTYQVVYKNFYGFDVVTFRYSILFSYGGSYEGKGAYITAAQIIPESVSTLFGYDFTATMKLGGIQNRGSRTNPVAAATLLMEHTVRTVLKAEVATAPYFITGKGFIKKI